MNNSSFSQKKTVFIDTEVLTDVLLKRGTFYDNALNVMESCANGDVKGFVSGHSLLSLWSLIKSEYSEEELKSLVTSVLSFLDVVDLNKEEILRSMKRGNFFNFEDSLQYECAIQVSADYIVARNKRNFENKRIPVLSPEEFMEMMACME